MHPLSVNKTFHLPKCSLQITYVVICFDNSTFNWNFFPTEFLKRKFPSPPFLKVLPLPPVHMPSETQEFSRFCYQHWLGNAGEGIIYYAEDISNRSSNKMLNWVNSEDNDWLFEHLQEYDHKTGMSQEQSVPEDQRVQLGRAKATQHQNVTDGKNKVSDKFKSLRLAFLWGITRDEIKKGFE